MTEWLKANLVAIVVASLSAAGSLVVGGRVIGQLDAVVASVAEQRYDIRRLSDKITQLEQRAAVLDERTATPTRRRDEP